MIVDARVAAAGGIPRPDICIVGAGPAGIALALELESSGKQILLIEAGGLQYDAATQRLFEGEVVGDRYPPLRDTRLAALGGSTGVWAGFCRPQRSERSGGDKKCKPQEHPRSENPDMLR